MYNIIHLAQQGYNAIPSKQEVKDWANENRVPLAVGALTAGPACYLLGDGTVKAIYQFSAQTALNGAQAGLGYAVETGNLLVRVGTSAGNALLSLPGQTLAAIRYGICVAGSGVMKGGTFTIELISNAGMSLWALATKVAFAAVAAFKAAPGAMLNGIKFAGASIMGGAQFAINGIASGVSQLAVGSYRVHVSVLKFVGQGIASGYASIATLVSKITSPVFTWISGAFSTVQTGATSTAGSAGAGLTAIKVTIQTYVVAVGSTIAKTAAVVYPYLPYIGIALAAVTLLAGAVYVGRLAYQAHQKAQADAEAHLQAMEQQIIQLADGQNAAYRSEQKHQKTIQDLQELLKTQIDELQQAIDECFKKEAQARSAQIELIEKQITALETRIEQAAKLEDVEDQFKELKTQLDDLNKALEKSKQEQSDALLEELKRLKKSVEAKHLEQSQSYDNHAKQLAKDINALSEKMSQENSRQELELKGLQEQLAGLEKLQKSNQKAVQELSEKVRLTQELAENNQSNHAELEAATKELQEQHQLLVAGQARLEKLLKQVKLPLDKAEN